MAKNAYCPVPSAHIKQLTATYNSNSRGYDPVFWPPVIYTYVFCACTHTQFENFLKRGKKETLPHSGNGDGLV